MGQCGAMPQEPHPRKGAKDRVIQLNCGEVRTHVSCKTTKEQKCLSSASNFVAEKAPVCTDLLKAILLLNLFSGYCRIPKIEGGKCFGVWKGFC